MLNNCYPEFTLNDISFHQLHNEVLNSYWLLPQLLTVPQYTLNLLTLSISSLRMLFYIKGVKQSKQWQFYWLTTPAALTIL